MPPAPLGASLRRADPQRPIRASPVEAWRPVAPEAPMLPGSSRFPLTPSPQPLSSGAVPGAFPGRELPPGEGEQ